MKYFVPVRLGRSGLYSKKDKKTLSRSYQNHNEDYSSRNKSDKSEIRVMVFDKTLF